MSKEQTSARRRPDFAEERAVLAQAPAGARVCGVDEVGRGPLAGPVVAAAATLSAEAADRLRMEGLDDSKRLSAPRRRDLAALLWALVRDGAADVALQAASVAEIESRNILGASEWAMTGAVARLSPRPVFALIDGSRTPKGLPCPARAVIGGDGRCLSVAAAALAAKVARDRLMARLAARWPGYGWETNAGYPSAAHRAALARLGPTPHHRRGFKGVPHHGSQQR